MCGILGVITTRNKKHAFSQTSFVKMRNMLAHRGPDACGLYHTSQASFGFQRLAILDPENGDQPFLWHAQAGTYSLPEVEPDLVLVFNGEIYNHLELRTQILAYDNRPFTSQCDSETLGRALYAMEEKAIEKLRGMFSFAAWWPKKQKLLLARDPYGMKPMYYGLIATDRVDDQAGIMTHPELIFASEPGPILSHPDVNVEPDWSVVSSYLSTLRTTMGNRTLYKGLFTLEPGEVLEADLSSCELKMNRSILLPHELNQQSTSPQTQAFAESELRHTIEESAQAHLLSDAPLCTMLSGGLDSTILSLLTKQQLQQRNEPLHTYAAGSRKNDDDPFYAQLASSQLHTEHHEVMINRDIFLETWPMLIQKTRLPVGTPNEIAIYHLGRQIQRKAKVVISGEGADEMFAGYEPPLSTTLAYLTQYNQVGSSNAVLQGAIQQPLPSPQDFYAQLISWIPPQHKVNVFSPSIHRAIDQDQLLFQTVDSAFAQAGDPADFKTHLKVHRHFNLTGLLQRLDQCLMLSGVEGRTPYADRKVEALANKLPVDWLFAPLPPMSSNETVRFKTKALLRQAFSDQIPDEISSRPKASFPLPFQQWLPAMTPLLKNSETLHQVLTPGIMTALTQAPSGLGIAAWPLANIGLWLMQWE